ncbi:MAG: protein kinase [Antricoccus sp.]
MGHPPQPDIEATPEDTTAKSAGFIADFQIDKPLGQGGSFFLAIPPERLRFLGDRVVLKVFPTEAAANDESAVQSLTTALSAIAAVRSDYLVRFIEAGRNNGVFYCAMEYLSGGSLAAPTIPLTMGEALRAVSNAARGAHALHEAGIPHRNIHPAGIILHAEGAKLADPGLASYLNPGMTLTGRLGIPEVDFIAPAIIRGQAASRETDLWSLGATLHYVASGQSIFPDLDRSSPVASLSAVLNTAPTIAQSLPGPVEDIVRQCLDPQHANRPATAAALAEHIDALWTTR